MNLQQLTSDNQSAICPSAWSGLVAANAEGHTPSYGNDHWTQRAETQELRRRFDSLAPRERQVMSLVVSGHLNKQIAYELGISERTIKLYRGQVMRKMGAPSLADLVKQAERLGHLR